MPYPQYPGKHEYSALVTPSRAIPEDFGPADSVPQRVVLVFHDGLVEHVLDAYEGEEFPVRAEASYALGDGVGVVRVEGVGAPAAALAVEELAHFGVERVCIVGFAGALYPDASHGEFVVADRALRDEGTSHHYLEPGEYVAAAESVRAPLESALDAAEEPSRVGPTWTTDAPYRETAPEVEQYRRDGVLAVEMEAAAVFAVAERRTLDAGALLVVSDVLDPGGWEPEFRATEDRLVAAFDVAVDALERA